MQHPLDVAGTPTLASTAPHTVVHAANKQTVELIATCQEALLARPFEMHVTSRRIIHPRQNGVPHSQRASEHKLLQLQPQCLHHRGRGPLSVDDISWTNQGH